jgi:hypothetical protein
VARTWLIPSLLALAGPLLFSSPAAASKPTRTDTIGGVALVADGDGYVARWTYGAVDGSGGLRVQRLDARGAAVGPRTVPTQRWTQVARVGAGLVGLRSEGAATSLTRVSSSLEPTGPSRILPFALHGLSLAEGVDGGVHIAARTGDTEMTFARLRADLSDAAPATTAEIGKEEGIVGGDASHWLTIAAPFVAEGGLARRVTATRRSPTGQLDGEPREIFATTNDESFFALHVLPRGDGDLVILPVDSYDARPARIEVVKVLPGGATEPATAIGDFGGDGRRVHVVDQGATFVLTSQEGLTDRAQVVVRRFSSSSRALLGSARLPLDPGTGVSAVACRDDGCVMLTAGGFNETVVRAVAIDGDGVGTTTTLDATPKLDDGSCSASPRKSRSAPAVLLLALCAVAALTSRRRRG